MPRSRKPRLAVWKFTSCDGCQLSLLDCEDDLLALAGLMEIAYFPEAMRRMSRGRYQISLVEGSITTPHDVERIQEVRRLSQTLVAMGACATAGGIQALRNLKDFHDLAGGIYAKPEVIDALTRSSPIAEHVPVDFELRGCPINKHQLLEVIGALLHGRHPNIPTHSLCMECKLLGRVCVMVAHGIPCLGPVTQAGCGALCPSFQRGCYGCFGPQESPNMEALAACWKRLGAAPSDLMRTFGGLKATPPVSSQESNVPHGQKEDR